ncbi:hypothetical protein [Ralstonia pseudosolanacearum]|uniref:hypothetical protein n=1 Tax=Ralstonia pseudosolanacearum TaxID=1310165 RepID=UPI0012EDDDEC|nr:hypothetical protein [Ralstonia pseudosolanacearum]MCQ4680786.1 hypothetical protein [Ralstonia pseudosolanacearum]
MLLKSLYNGLPDFLSPVSSRRAEEYGTSVRQDLERGGYEAPKGFEVDQFSDAFARYLSSAAPGFLGHSVTESPQTHTQKGIAHVAEGKSVRSRDQNPVTSAVGAGSIRTHATEKVEHARAIDACDRNPVTQISSVTNKPLLDKGCDRVTDVTEESLGGEKKEIQPTEDETEADL